VTCGNIGTMYQWILDPNSLVLCGVNMSGGETPMRFKVNDVDGASDIIISFAKGMGIDMKGTIFTSREKCEL
jgi:hypothetical protein